MAADAGPQADHQPAGDGRDGHAERLRRLDRVDAPQPGPPRLGRAVAAPAQRPRHRRRRRRAGLPGRRRPDRGLPVRQRRAHRQRLPGHAGPEPVQPGHRPADRLLATSTRSGAPSSTATSCRCTSGTRTAATWSTPRSPARTRTRSRRASTRWSATPRPPACRSTSSAWAVPYLPIDPQGRRPHLRGRHPGQLQSGKGGVAYIMKTEHHLDLPRRLQIEFSGSSSSTPTTRAARSSPAQMWEIFADEYLRPPAYAGRAERARTRRPRPTSDDELDGRRHARRRASAPCAATATARSPRSSTRCRRSGIDVRVLDYAEHALSVGRRRHGGGVRGVRDRRADAVGRRRRRQHRHRVAEGVVSAVNRATDDLTLAEVDHARVINGARQRSVHRCRAPLGAVGGRVSADSSAPPVS